MVDFKMMNPDKFEGPRGKVPFRQWCQDMKDLASRYSDNLHEAMIKVEYSNEAVRPEKVRELGVEVFEDSQLRSATRAFTQGEARNFISTEINKNTTGLEVWRMLMSLYDPNNDSTRMDESTFVLNPGKANGDERSTRDHGAMGGSSRPQSKDVGKGASGRRLEEERVVVHPAGRGRKRAQESKDLVQDL